jgi:hypothetical protein
MLYFVYELIDPRTNEPRYVGITVNPNLRFEQHMSDKQNDKKRIWIQELSDARLEPRMKILEVAESYDEGRQKEKDWIKARLTGGHCLTNIRSNIHHEKSVIHEKSIIDPLKRKANIAIDDSFGGWIGVAERDYGATSKICAPEIATLPEDVAEQFDVSLDEQFFKRVQLTSVDGTVICSWATYCPLDVINDALEPSMSGLAEHLKQKNRIAPVSGMDIYFVRRTTLDELDKFHLVNHEAVLILRRALYGADKSQPVLISDMTLLGSWFIHEEDSMTEEA